MTCSKPPLAALALPPSTMKLTLPVGVPMPGAAAVMVAMRVTGRPIPDGLAVVLIVVVVASALTVWLTDAEVDGPVDPSPLYLATMLCVPTVRFDSGMSTAFWPAGRLAVANCVLPSNRPTEPVGVGAPETVGVT